MKGLYSKPSSNPYSYPITKNPDPYSYPLSSTPSNKPPTKPSAPAKKGLPADFSI